MFKVFFKGFNELFGGFVVIFGATLGFVGFILSAVILYVTQFFVAGYSISWLSAIIGALIYGIIDYIMPGEQKM